MLRDKPEYRRLNVGGHGAVGSASYWAGKEHLLVVVNAGYVEKYRRFGYADIQAFMVRRTRVHYVWGFSFAAVGIGCILGAFEMVRTRAMTSLSQGDQVWLGLLLLIAVIAIGLTVANGLIGPTFVCHLRTALQIVRLPQIRRWKKAQRLLAELTPLVVEAQK